MMTTSQGRDNIVFISFIVIIVVQLLCTILNFCVLDFLYLVILVVYFYRYILAKKRCL